MSDESEQQVRMKDFPRQKSFMEPDVNPFIHKIKLTTAQKIQVAIMSVTIAPIRIFMFFFSLFIMWIFARIITIGMKVHVSEPVGQVRAALCNSLRLMGRIGLFFVGLHNIEVRGKRAMAEEAPIMVVAPHSTFFDVFIAFVTEPLPSSVSRIENYETPLFGRLIQTMQPVYVSRKDPDSRRKAIDELKRRSSVKGKWPQVLVFPEGTCTNRKSLITFKAGSFIPAVPVQPVAIEYLNDLDTVTWTMSGPGGFTLLWLTLCQFQLKVRVTYLPVYVPNRTEKENPKLYANNVKRVMAEVLNIPCTDHTFEDCRLMRHAAHLNLPMESGLVEFSKLSRKLGMDIDSVQNRLAEFAQIACERSDGRISIDDFARFLNVPITPALQEMFDLYDRNQSGVIDFREYVIGLSLVSQPAVTEDTVRLAFKVFDSDQNGTISEEEFNHVLFSTFEDEINGKDIFNDIKKSCPDRVAYEEFYAFVKARPEYAKLFVWYKDMGEDKIENEISDNMSSSTTNQHVNSPRNRLQKSNKVDDSLVD